MNLWCWWVAGMEASGSVEKYGWYRSPGAWKSLSRNNLKSEEVHMDWVGYIWAKLIPLFADRLMDSWSLDTSDIVYCANWYILPYQATSSLANDVHHLQDILMVPQLSPVGLLQRGNQDRTLQPSALFHFSPGIPHSTSSCRHCTPECLLEAKFWHTASCILNYELDQQAAHHMIFSFPIFLQEDGPQVSSGHYSLERHQ